MENTENKDYAIAEPIQKLLERAQHTNAGLGGYLVYMAILLVLLVVDTIYYEKNVWYDVDYDIYSGLLQFVILLYTTIYLFRGTEGHRIIYGWKRWTLGSVFAIWTLLAALGAWVSVEQTGEEIHSKTDFQAEMIAEIRDNELFSRVLGFLFIASCLGLWYWTESIRKIEEEYQGEEGNVEEEEEQGERRIVLKNDNEEDAESNEEDNEDEDEDEEDDDEEDEDEEEDDEEEDND